MCPVLHVFYSDVSIIFPYPHSRLQCVSPSMKQILYNFRSQYSTPFIFAYSCAAYYCELIWKFHFYTLLLVFHQCLPAHGCIYPTWPLHLWPFLSEDLLSCLTLSCMVLCMHSFICPQSVLFSHSSSRGFCKRSVGLAFIICSVDSGGRSN